ncbi:MAG: hypothetical protein QOK47_445, partial [Actinomycetota bacterium]|nr:hypothetical protein [Actinomycetota bacterium]
TLLKVKSGKDAVIGKFSSKTGGKFAFRKAAKRGKYFVKAAKKSFTTDSIPVTCSAAKSKIFTKK